jgi:methionine-gamma-lyase
MTTTPATDADTVRPVPRRHPDTRAVHVSVPGPAGSRPVAVPLYQTSTFAFDDPDACAEALVRPDRGFAYSRYSNPTTRALEDAMAGLEGGAAAIATASGMGAINAVLLAHLRPGDHVIAQRRLYGGTTASLADLVGRFGIAVTYVSGDDPAEVRAALRDESVLLFLETIANPTVTVADLPALCAVGREAGLVCVVDNTFASPVLCRPLEHGADVVIHSTTKYVNGHSDVTGGIAVFADAERHRAVQAHTIELGMAADPFAAWLTIRGLATLPLRMRRHCDNADLLARRLAEHPAVTAVHWPGLPGHPSHAVANRLLRCDGRPAYGGVLAFDLAGGREAGRAFSTGLRLASIAASLGGVGTLVLHPASTSHRKLGAAELRDAGIGEGTIRVAVGIEHPDDLWEDLGQALDRL